MLDIFIVCRKGKRGIVIGKVYRREQAALVHCQKLNRYYPFENKYEVRKVTIEL